MKMYYKPLDITQLSGSPWNTAEKVLGLDQDDKVIMAEPEETVTPEYVDEAIDQAMEAETARTEDTYAKKSDVPDLDDYYTKEEVDEAISGITVDLSDYYTKDETDQAISAATQDLASTDYVDDAIANETARTESTYLKQSDIEDDQFPTKNWVKGHTALAIEHSMEAETARTESTYAKKSEIPSLDGYAKTTAVTQDIQTAMASETARTESTYLKEHQSLDNYYTKSQVDAEITGATEGLASEQYVDDAIAAIPAVDLSPYAKTTAVTQDIQTAMAAETARTESTYLKEHQSLDNYYNKSEVDAKFVSASTEVGNAIDAAVQGLASETYVDNAVAGLASEGYVDAAVTAATEGLASEEYVDNAVAGIVFPDDYATTGDVASAVEGLASESYVDDAITSATEGMATQSDLEGLASESYVDDAVNGVVQGIGMLGMVNDVSESNGTVTVQKTTMQEGQLVTGSTSFNIATPGDIQTAIASETARTESTYLKEHQSLDNYYTKSQVDAEITGATEDMATKTWVGQQGYLTQHQDLSAYAKTTAVTEDIASAMAAETARTESTYLKEHQDISGKLDKTDFDTYTGATATVLAEKLDASAYTVDNAIDSASTNPVENRVLNAALNGVTATTELTITNTDSAWQFFCDSNSKYYHFKDTSISKYKAVYLGDLDVTGLSTFNLFMADSNYNWKYMTPSDRPSTSNVGTIKYFIGSSGSSISFRKNLLDGTFEYYILLDTEDMYFVVYKTLPASITTISDHKANVSDLPVAQDNSDTKFFVYDDPGRSKGVVREVYLNYGYEINANSRVPEIRTHSTSWSGSIFDYNMRPIPGNEVVGGIKSAKDSVIINNAASALDGFTEQITLTLGNQSATDYAYLNWGNRYLYETDDPRYEVIPVSASTDANYTYFETVSLSGRTYYIENPINNFYNYSLNGKYELNTLNNGYGIFCIRNSYSGQNYLIIDKELLTVELSATLTITRTKNLNGAFVEPKDLTGGTETIIHTESVTIVGDSENVETEFSRDGSNSTYLRSLKTTTNSSIFAYYLDSSEIFGKPFDFYINFIRISGTTYYFTTSPTAGDGVTASLSTTDSGNRVYSSENYNGYLILDTSNMEVSFASSLPVITTEETVTTIGILEDYWTTGETQSAITAATQGMVTSGDVATQIGTAMASETARTESTYAKPSQIPSLTGYATEQWVQNQGYLTQHQSLDNYYTKTEIDGMIGDIESLLASI